MALQSSGQISISDILTEGGQSATRANTSLRDLEDGNVFTINTDSPSKPNGSVPNAISEWYSYDHSYVAYSNDYFYFNDGVNDYIQGPWEGQTSLADNDWSISFWVKQNQTTVASQQLWDFNADGTIDSGNTTDRVFLQYVGSTNRLLVRVRTNSTNFDRQVSLHDNIATTGVSSAGWTSSNRGNVNALGFCMITVVYDSSQTTGAAAFKIYWNGTELTGSPASTNGTRTNNILGSLCLCASQHATTSGNAAVLMDEWAFYSDTLTSGEITSIYNSGTIVSPHTIHTDNLQEVVQFGESSTINTYIGNYSGIISGGVTDAY